MATHRRIMINRDFSGHWKKERSFCLWLWKLVSLESRRMIPQCRCTVRIRHRSENQPAYKIAKSSRNKTMSSFFFFSSFLVKFQVVLMFQVQKKREQGLFCLCSLLLEMWSQFEHINEKTTQIQCFFLHSCGTPRPHFWGNSRALAGLAPNLLRSALCLQRQGKSAFFRTLQHPSVGFGGEIPVIAGRHWARSISLTLQTTELGPVSSPLAVTAKKTITAKMLAMRSMLITLPISVFWLFSTWQTSV